MSVAIEKRYQLKALHEDIDLYDRKLAHLLKYDTFPTEAARDSAAKRLNQKRELLVKTARQLAAEGTEFKPSELPRSFRSTDAPVTAAEEEPATAEQQASEPLESQPSRVARRSGSHTGAALDWQASVREFIEKRAAKR